MLLLAMVVANNEIDKDKNAGELLAILIAMQMRRYNAGGITQWSTSMASLEAPGCFQWTSACTVLPRARHGWRF